jgi:hypothetical protein
MGTRAYDTTSSRGGIRAMDACKANDRIAMKAEQLQFVSRVPMLCECSAPDCRTIVMIALADFYEIRLEGGSVIAPGHAREGAVADGGRRSA